jgi:predicted dehydrogenase
VAEKKYGVLIHGAGWVSTQHIAAFSANPHSEVVALSSRTLESPKKRAAEAGLKDVAFYDDLVMHFTLVSAWAILARHG